LASPLFISQRAMGFSGVDISASIHIPEVTDNRGNVLSGGAAYQMGAIQTMSYSIYSSKEASRSLGFKLPTGFSRGQKTIAGTLIFNQLNTHVFDDVGYDTVLQDKHGALSYSSGSLAYYRLAPFQYQLDPKVTDPEFEEATQKRHMVDFSWDTSNITRLLHATDMPPFDIIVTFVNELGNVGKLVIYGVELLHESSTLSVEDIYTEVVYQYVARDMESFSAKNWEQTVNWRSQILRQDSISQSEVSTASNNALSEQQQLLGLDSTGLNGFYRRIQGGSRTSQDILTNDVRMPGL